MQACCYCYYYNYCIFCCCYHHHHLQSYSPSNTIFVAASHLHTSGRGRAWESIIIRVSRHCIDLHVYSRCTETQTHDTVCTSSHFFYMNSHIQADCCYHITTTIPADGGMRLKERFLGVRQDHGMIWSNNRTKLKSRPSIHSQFKV